MHSSNLSWNEVVPILKNWKRHLIEVQWPTAHKRDAVIKAIFEERGAVLIKASEIIEISDLGDASFERFVSPSPERWEDILVAFRASGRQLVTLRKYAKNEVTKPSVQAASGTGG